MRRLWALIGGFLLAILVTASISVGCSLLLDLKECEDNDDCLTAGKICHDGVCIPELDQ